jgi:hypothetical protein
MKHKCYIYNKGFEAIKNNICDTSYGLCPAPMDAQLAVNILCDYLLGDDWYFAGSASVEQGNAMVVELILDKYSKQFKKDWKNFEKYDQQIV